VSDSFANLGKQSDISLTVSLGVSADQLQQIDHTISSAEAQAISTGSLFLYVQSGHGEALNSTQFRTDADNRVALGLHIGSSTPIELRYVGQNLYIHADVAGLAKILGAPPGTGTQFINELHAAGQYAQGKWVEISQASLAQLGAMLKQSSGTGGSTAPDQSQIVTAIGKLRDDLVTAFKNNATYKDMGTTNGVTHYQATLQVRDFVQQAGSALSNDLGALPGASMITGKLGDSIGKAASNISATQTAIIDLYVQNDTAQEISVDLNQFAGKDKVSFQVPLKVVFGSSPTITAPAGATPLDLSELLQLLGGLAGQAG
jgi:hypothetical protein